ncbi:MAG: TonB-dependent receptor [Alphaproteobacteria bacterium]|nr:TonB-dependent receptor [Alphaproteobacteria bacterium]MCB9795387.1 TonB-dependent receptor [Alphaproteobacteria bacterium]
MRALPTMTLLLLASPALAGPDDAEPSEEESAEEEAAEEESPQEADREREAGDEGPPAPDGVAFTPPALLSAPELPWPGGPPYAPVDVVLLLLIDEAGQIEELSLMEGAPPWSDIAVERAQGLRFSPAMEYGEPIMVEVPFTWTFAPPPVQIAGVLKVDGGAPAARASLRLGELELETDTEGRFELRELPPGSYTLELIDEVLQLAPIPLEVVPGERLDLELTASLQSQEYEAVGMYRAPTEQVIRRSLTAEELRTTPGTMGDPVRAVQNMPGVIRTPFDSGWLIVRGGDPNDTGTFIDGVRVPLVYHLGGFTSVLHPAFIERVDFMPGGYGARYGRATAGAVDLVTKDVRAERRVEAGADLIYAGAYAQTPIGENHGVAVSIRRSYLDWVLAQVLSEEQANIAPRFYDWQARWDSKHAGLFWMGYSDTIVAPTGDGDKTAEVTIRTNRVHGRVDIPLGAGNLRLTPTFATDARALIYDDIDDQRDTETFGFRAQWSDDGSGQLGYQLGLDLEAWKYQIAVNGITKEATVLSPDPYAELRVGRDRHVTLGMRLETYKVNQQIWRVSPSPRVQARWPISRSFSLVGDAGVYHQLPPMEWMVGLPTGPYLDPERAYGQGLGARWQAKQVSLEVDGYWKRLEKVTIFEDDGTLGQGSGLAYGVESLARWRAGSWAGWVSYTWSRSLRRQEPGDLLQPFLYDQPHYVLAVASWGFGQGWNLSGRFRAGSGYPWDRVSDEAYDILTLSPFPLVPNANQRLRPYHGLDLKVAKHAQWRAWSLEFYLEAQNVYNRRIEEPIITGVDDRETVYGKGLPTLPIFGVKGAWTGGA